MQSLFCIQWHCKVFASVCEGFACVECLWSVMAANECACASYAIYIASLRDRQWHLSDILQAVLGCAWRGMECSGTLVLRKPCLAPRLSVADEEAPLRGHWLGCGCQVCQAALGSSHSCFSLKACKLEMQSGTCWLPKSARVVHKSASSNVADPIT
jgi:hypothetical protein